MYLHTVIIAPLRVASLLSHTHTTACYLRIYHVEVFLFVTDTPRYKALLFTNLEAGGAEGLARPRGGFCDTPCYKS